MLLPSSKNAADKYENDSLTKAVFETDLYMLAQTLQYLLEATQGYSLSGNQGASQVQDLSIITDTNYTNYQKTLLQTLQTLVANDSYLAVNGSSTANSIILEPRKISDIDSPNGTNYSKTADLPFAFRDNLKFVFRATATNTGATQVQITGLSGLSGAIDIVDEDGNNLAGGEIINGKFHEIVLTGADTTKKAILKKPNIPNASTTIKGIVELLTNAELATGTDTTRAATAAGIASLFGSSTLSQQGIIEIPCKVSGAFSKIAIQFVSSAISANSVVNITYPQAFSSLFQYATCNEQVSGSGTLSVVTASTTQITLKNQWTGGSIIGRVILIGVI